MKKKSLLTKVKTKVSTRTALLIALGLVIIGGAAFGLAPLLKTNTIFNISDSGLKIGTAPLTMVVFSGQDGSANSAVPTICNALKNKGIIKYDIDYANSKANFVTPITCSQKNWLGKMTGSFNYQAFNIKTTSFFAGSCWGNTLISYYTSVNCAIKACVVEGGSLGAVVPGNYAQCCSGLVPYIPNGLIGSRGTCQKSGYYVPPYTAPYTPPYTAPQSNLSDIAFYNPSDMGIGKYGNIIVSLRNDIAYLEVVMLNIGNFPMSQVSAQLKIDAYINGQYMQSAYLDSVDWLSHGSISSNARASFTSGLNLANYKGQTITLKLVADPNNAIKESNEGNNMIEAKVAIPSVFNVVFMEPLSQ